MPYKELRPYPKNLPVHQVQLPLIEVKTSILDEESGALKLNGWSIQKDLASKIHINYERAITPWLPRPLSFIKYRAWNFVMIYTPDHIIQIPLAYVFPMCSNSIQVYPRVDVSRIL